MEKIFRFFGKEYGNINQAALLLGVLTLCSQILALFRDRFIASFIGPSATLDSYYAAFRIPDLIFICVASLASITVIIPFLVARTDGNTVTDKARKYLSDIFTVFFFFMVAVAVVAFIIMPHLVFFIAPGFAPIYQAKVVLLSRIMLLSPILMGLSNLFGTVTQLFHKFFIYSLSPILYNIGIIIGVVFLYPYFGVYGMALGVVLGALMHFGIQAWSAHSCGFTPRFSFQINFSEIKQAVLTSLPRTLGLAFNNIALICIIAFASFLKSGSISVFNFAFNLQSVPLNIIGISYAVAAFPTLAKSFRNEDKREFVSHLKQASRAIIFWSLPVIFLFIVLRAQIVRVILGSSAFSWDNTKLVAACLAIFAISVVAQGMITLLSRAYYATGDTKRPLIVNFICSLFIIVLAYTFIHLFEQVSMFRYFIESLLKVNDIDGTEVLMLPLAYSVGTILNFILHWIFIKKDFMSNEPFITKTFLESLGASFCLGLVTYYFLNILGPVFGTITFWGVFLQGLISGILGIISAIIVLYVVKNEQIHQVADALGTKFWKAKILAPSQEGL